MSIIIKQTHISNLTIRKRVQSDKPLKLSQLVEELLPQTRFIFRQKASETDTCIRLVMASKPAQL